MDADLQKRIEETVVDILEKANMEEMTEHKVREEASKRLDVDLSLREHKQFVRQVVESFLTEQHQKEEQKQADEEAEEQEKGSNRGPNEKEYDDEGNLVICRLSDKRKVAMSEFKGKKLVSIREYYTKDGKELPSYKGISLTAEQWASLYENVPAIEKAIDKMTS